MVELTLTLGRLCPSGLILFFAAGVDIVVIQLDGGDKRQRILNCLVSNGCPSVPDFILLYGS